MQIHELNAYGGSLNSGAFLAVDNGSDTGKVPVTDITDPLNERIDNIVSGPAPSEAEIIDARLAADGQVYPSLGAAIRGQVDNIYDYVDDVSDFVGMAHRIYFVFESGSINNTTGDEESNGYRIRTADYISTAGIKSVTFTPVTGYQCNIFRYDSDKNFTSRTQTTTPYTLSKGDCAYFRLVVWRSSSDYAHPSVDNPYTDYLGISVSYDDESNFITKEVAENFIGLGDPDDLLLAFVPSNNFSDLTVIGNKLYCFKASDGGVGTGSIFEYDLDFENKTATRTKVLYHHWGHCNSVDYCPETDSLFLAYEYNGPTYDPADYVDGIFYVIPGISTIIDNASSGTTLSDLSSIAIEYDCQALNWGTFLNGCWGYNNYGAYDLVIINTNRCKNYRVVQLGKGTNNLGLGNYVAAGADEFNGSFAVIKSFTLDIDPPAGYVNQGADFYNGVLYLGMGHYHDLYWLVELKYDGSAHVINEMYMPITDASGTLQSGSTEGVCITTTCMIANITTDLGNRVEIRKR